MGLDIVNERYAERLVEARGFRDSAAADRLAVISELIDFDSIKNICDIGSRFLEQSKEFAYIFDTANIYAYEPVPESFQVCLNALAALESQQQARVNIYNLAVGNEDKLIPFYPVNDVNGENWAGASSKYKFIPGMNGSWWGKAWTQNEILVSQVTLDGHRAKNNIGPVDLIWMDVQGGELDVLLGATETLKDVKVILTEVGLNAYYDGQSLKPQIDDFLRTQGFRELRDGFKLNFKHEGDTIYIKEGLVNEDSLLP